MFSRRTDWDLVPNRLSAAVQSHRGAGREVFDVAESNPTRCGLEYDQATILASVAGPASLEYCPEPRGLLTARQAVASYYADRGGESVEVDPARIILTTSTSEAYSYIFRLLCDVDDEVLVPTPSYPLFEFLAGLHDVKLAPYPLIYDYGWQIDLHSLERALTSRTRAVMVVHPNNPTGSLVSAAELSALNEICRAREMAIVADEVFLDYAHDGVARRSFAANDEVLTVALSGLSKIAGLPQMKVAWLVASGPAKLREQALARLEVIADTFLSMNAPLQHALPALLRQGQSISHQLLTRIRHNLAELDRQLAAQRVCQRLQVQAGWYCVLRVPVMGSDEELAIALLEQESVLVHPGHFYDFHRDGYLVLSLITPVEVFREGARRLLGFVSKR
jgi:alanine-synthesizing transaminase